MAEYIKREAVIDLITRRYENPEICTQEINSIPATDVAPVRHARWKRYGRNLGECSNCGEIVNIRYNYCPNCGAKMDGGDSDAKSV